MQIKVTEKDEVEFLKTVITVLRRFELANELFPELNAPESGGPYFVMQGASVQTFCTELFEEMVRLQGDEKPQPGGTDGVLV